MTRAEILNKAKPFLTGPGAVKCIYVAENGQVFRHASLAHRFEQYEGITVHSISLDDYPGRDEGAAPASSESEPKAAGRRKKTKTKKD